MTNYLCTKRIFILSFHLCFILFGFSQNIVVTPAINNTSVSTCSSFIIDSGNQGGPGYGNNENVTFTLCPATTGQAISLSFGLFNLDLTDDNASTTITNVDYLKIFDGNSTSAPLLGTYTGNSLQGAVVVGNSTNTSGCLTIQFYSNLLGTGKFAFSASCDTPCNNPVANAKITGGLTNDSIKVCMGETVGFENFGSFAQTGFTLATYSWDFMDGTSATGQNSTHAYTVPGQYRVQLRVTDDNGCGNNNLTDLKVYVGTAPEFDPFPSDSTICLGQELELTATPNDYEVLWDGFNQSNTITDGCLTDNLLGTPQNVEVSVSGFIAGITITDINQIQSLCIGMEHSFIGDIVITVKCPTGQSLILHQQGGGGTELGTPVEQDNVDCNDPSTIGEPGNYCFTPAATETWVDYVNNNNFPNSIPDGDYAPIGNFTDLLGCPANGVWTLSVVDNWAADDGTLFSFGINLSPDLYQDLITFQPQIGLAADSSYWLETAAGITSISADKDVLQVKPIQPGVYAYKYIVKDDFGCTYDTTVTITVAPNPSLNAGNDTLVCAGSPIDLNGILGSGGVGTCSYVLQMDDTFGDGWNGNNLIFTVNGVPTSYTLAIGSSETVTLNFPSGSTVSYLFDGLGSFISECSFTITGPGTNITQGPLLSGSVNGSFVADCTPPYEVSWTPANLFTDPTQFETTVSVTGETMLTLTVNPVGFPECAFSDSLLVSLYSPIQIQSITQDTTICNGQSVNLNVEVVGADGVYSYSWSDGTAEVSTNQTTVVSPTITTNYCVTASNVCSNSTDLECVTVSMPDPIYPNLSPDVTSGCLPLTVTFTNNTVSNFIASTSLLYDGVNQQTQTTLSPFQYTFMDDGTHDVYMSVLSIYGCTYDTLYSDLITTYNGPSSEFVITPEHVSMFTPNTNLLIINPVDTLSYSWEIPNGTPNTSTNNIVSVSYPEEIPGAYPVSLITSTQDGCRDTTIHFVYVDSDVLVYVPNSFTPDGDQFNPLWKISILGASPDRFELNVFDRWGQVIWTTQSQTDGWDGTFGGKLLQSGIYTWRITCRDLFNDKKREFTGFVQLLR